MVSVVVYSVFWHEAHRSCDFRGIPNGLWLNNKSVFDCTGRFVFSFFKCYKYSYNKIFWTYSNIIIYLVSAVCYNGNVKCSDWVIGFDCHSDIRSCGLDAGSRARWNRAGCTRYLYKHRYIFRNHDARVRFFASWLYRKTYFII